MNTNDPEGQLFLICRTFIEQQRIYCSETIYQTDRVMENAQEFIERICDVVGYAKYEDD